YVARIDYDADENLFLGQVVGLRESIHFHGASVDELRADFEFAIDDYLARCDAAGLQPERQVSGRLLLRLKPELHADAIAMAIAEGKSLNQWVSDVLAAAIKS
ncbi:MAG: type II toxin-antitoxin system HicB family antitoxin, partial [Betaproteobacteria bacterium]|nr:type II toxin-antitoxin system HicB family antitoxin [Betaproteobacteria bacterium]